MTILNAIRDRFSPSAPSTSAREPSTSARDALPFAGYDRLDDREVIEGLSDHSQIELDAAEGERSGRP